MLPGPARIFVIATPIGNLSDITLRAVQCLKEADLILCEDTRVTRKLLSHLGIEGKTVWRLNEFGGKSLDPLMESLAGKSVALVSDSGTPALSDPGARLIQAARCPVIPIPGPSSAAAALSISGLGQDGFVFLGFLPKSAGKIRREIEAAAALEKAVIFFESPFRIVSTMEILETLAPRARVVLCRELTKVHEEILRGTPAEILAALKSKPKILGEITVVLENQ